MVTLYNQAKERFNELSIDFDERMSRLPEEERFNCPQEEMMTFGKDVQTLVQMNYDSMIEYLGDIPANIRNIVGLFETNCLIYNHIKYDFFCLVGIGCCNCREKQIMRHDI